MLSSSVVSASGPHRLCAAVWNSTTTRWRSCKRQTSSSISSEWRFLKAALQDWLRAPARKSGKQALLALAGAWKDDPDIEEIVRQAQRRRGRPSAEPEP